MKVRELIERLQECPPESTVLVYLDTDPEFGHGFEISGEPEVTETTSEWGTTVLIERAEGP